MLSRLVQGLGITTAHISWVVYALRRDGARRMALHPASMLEGRGLRELGCYSRAWSGSEPPAPRVSPTRGGAGTGGDDADVFRRALSPKSSVPAQVVTVPAYFDERQRAATLLAAQLAGLPRVQLLQGGLAVARTSGFTV